MFVLVCSLVSTLYHSRYQGVGEGEEEPLGVGEVAQKPQLEGWVVKEKKSLSHLIVDLAH